MTQSYKESSQHKIFISKRTIIFLLLVVAFFREECCCCCQAIALPSLLIQYFRNFFRRRWKAKKPKKRSIHFLAWQCHRKTIDLIPRLFPVERPIAKKGANYRVDKKVLNNQNPHSTSFLTFDKNPAQKDFLKKQNYPKLNRVRPTICVIQRHPKSII